MDYVGHRIWFFALSLLVILPGVGFLLTAPGLKPGIDFTGGSTLTLSFSEPVEQEDLRLSLADRGQPDSIVQRMEESVYFVRTKELQEEAKNTLIDGLIADLDLPLGAESVPPEIDEVPEGRSIITLRLTQEVTEEEIFGHLDQLGHPDATTASAEKGSYMVFTRELPAAERDALAAGLVEALGEPIKVLSFDLVSPAVARETVIAAFWAVVMAALGVFLYLWWAFRNVPSPFRYGAAAVLALVHDSMVVIGIFAALGVLFDVEVNTMFLIALLTVIGYSVNDTIVIFDRIRENITLHPNRPLASNANLSISESLGRSINTSLTLLFTLMALLLFGGPTIRVFLWVLVIGVMVGTYSSIGIATNTLVAWESGDFRRLFGLPRRRAPTQAA